MIFPLKNCGRSGQIHLLNNKQQQTTNKQDQTGTNEQPYQSFSLCVEILHRISMLITPEEVRLGQEKALFSPCSDSVSSFQDLESSQQHFKDLTDSYETIELLKKSLKQLSSLTKQQAEKKTQRTATGTTTFENSEITAPTGIKIESFEIRQTRSKTVLSRRGSFCSQASVGSIASSKTVRFGSVSILTAQELVHKGKSISITTVDDFEKRSKERRIENAQKKRQEKDESAVLDEYVRMAQSTRRRRQIPDNRQLSRTLSSSALSQTEDAKARLVSLCRNTAPTTTASSSPPGPLTNVTIPVEPKAVSPSESSKACSKASTSSRSRRGGFVKMLSKTFGRRKGKRNPKLSNSSNDIDISEVTMDDNVTETSSNDDSAALVTKVFKGKRRSSSMTGASTGFLNHLGRQRTACTVQPSPLTTNDNNNHHHQDPSTDPPKSNGRVSRRNSNASSVSNCSTGLVQKAVGLLSRRMSNGSDVSSIVSSTASSAGMGHPDYNNHIIIPPIAFDEITFHTAEPVPTEEDTTKLQNEIADLKKQLMGLVLEHMEESELRKRAKSDMHMLSVKNLNDDV